MGIKLLPFPAWSLEEGHILSLFFRLAGFGCEMRLEWHAFQEAQASA